MSEPDGSSTREGSSERSPLIDGVCELTLQSRDPAELADFYREALGCEELSREPDRIWLSCGDRARLGLWSPGTKEFGDRGGSHVHFALSAAPGVLDTLGERLRGMGVELTGPVRHDGGDRSLYFEDPEGNVVEIWDFFQRGQGAREGVQALK